MAHTLSLSLLRAVLIAISLTLSHHDLYMTHRPYLQLWKSSWFVQHPLAISSTPSFSQICRVRTDHIFIWVTQCDLYSTHWPYLQLNPSVWFVQHPLAISSTLSLSLHHPAWFLQYINVHKLCPSDWFVQYPLAIFSTASPSGIWTVPRGHLLNCIYQCDLLEYSLNSAPQSVLYSSHHRPSFQLCPPTPPTPTPLNPNLHSAMYSARTSTGHVNFVPPFINSLTF